MSKTIYVFDPTTFVYLGTAQAEPDQLQPDEVLMPMYATSIAPPVAGEHEVAVFNEADNAWTTKIDLRGEELYSTETGARVVCSEIGKTPADLKATLVPPPSASHSWANGKWVLDATKQAEALAAAKTNALTRIDQFHSAVIDKLVGNPTQTEKDTWAMKLDTANAIALGQPVAAAGAAFLHAAGLNDTTAQNNWARSVLAKSTGYAQVVGVAERLRDAAKTAVKAATDEAAVQAALEAQHAAADAAVAAISKT